MAVLLWIPAPWHKSEGRDMFTSPGEPLAAGLRRLLLSFLTAPFHPHAVIRGTLRLPDLLEGGHGLGHVVGRRAAVGQYFAIGSFTPEELANLPGPVSEALAVDGIPAAGLQQLLLDEVEGGRRRLVMARTVRVPAFGAAWTRASSKTDLGAEKVMSRPGRCSCLPSRRRPRRVCVPGTRPEGTCSKRRGLTGP